MEMGIDLPQGTFKEVTRIIYELPVGRNLTEHEYCVIYTGVYEGEFSINKEEVEKCMYAESNKILQDIRTRPVLFSQWFIYVFPLICNTLAAQISKSK